MAATLIVRDWLLERIKPLGSRTWKWIETQRTIDRPTGTTVILKQTEIRPGTPAHSVRDVDYTLALIVPNQNTGQAEHRLDDNVLDFLNQLDTVEGLVWTRAVKVVAQLAGGEFPAYDIYLTVSIQKEQ